MAPSMNKWLSKFEFISCIYTVCFLNIERKMCGVEVYLYAESQAPGIP